MQPISRKSGGGRRRREEPVGKKFLQFNGILWLVLDASRHWLDTYATHVPRKAFIRIGISALHRVRFCQNSGLLRIEVFPKEKKKKKKEGKRNSWILNFNSINSWYKDRVKSSTFSSESHKSIIDLFIWKRNSISCGLIYIGFFDICRLLSSSPCNNTTETVGKTYPLQGANETFSFFFPLPLPSNVQHASTLHTKPALQL